MGKGGGRQQQQTDQTVVQTNLPKYVEPYFKRLLERTEAESKREYTPYEGKRLADESTDLIASRDKVRDIANTGILGLGDARDATSKAIQRGIDSMNYEAEMFTPEQAEKYMSPYMQNVIDRRKDNALRDFQKLADQRAARAISAGAFSGSGRIIADMEAEEQLKRQMDDITAEGTQQAYSDAIRAFGADRDARADAEKLGIGAAEMASAQGQQLMNLEAKARAGDIESARLLEQIGKAEMAREQSELDIGYEDFIRQRDDPREALQFYSSILRGVPISPSTDTQKFTQYNPLQDILGTGIAALGLYRGFGGG